MTSSIASMASANNNNNNNKNNSNKSYKNSKKLDEVKEVIQNKPDADIIKVLEVYDNDVAKTINAFMNDGAKEALSKWKQKKSKKTESPNTLNTNSSSSSSNGNKPSRKSNNTNQSNQNGRSSHINDLVSSIIDQYTSTNETNGSEHPNNANTTTTTNNNNNNSNSSSKATTVNAEQHNLLLNNLNNLIISKQPLNLCVKSMPGCGLKVKVIGIEQASSEQSTQHSSPLTSTSTSTSTSSPSSLSIQSTSSCSHDAKPLKQQQQQQQETTNIHINFAYTNVNNSKNMLDKPQRDLQRQSALLAKIASQFEEDLTKSQLVCNQMFQEMKQLINERQSQMQADLSELANAAHRLLNERQNKAAHLKFFADNVVHLDDHDTQELKADIKHFLNERQLDEELVKIKIFQEDNIDQVCQSIRSFGRIAQLNVQYAAKRPPTEELLNSSFSSSLTPLLASNRTNNDKPKQIDNINNNSNSNSNSSNVQKKHSIRITDIDGLSDQETANNKREGEFIEVKKPQRNRNRQANVQAANQPSANGKSSSGVSQTSLTNGGLKTQKQNGAPNSGPVNKRNVNSFSLIANGKV